MYKDERTSVVYSEACLRQIVRYMSKADALSVSNLLSLYLDALEYVAYCKFCESKRTSTDSTDTLTAKDGLLLGVRRSQILGLINASTAQIRKQEQRQAYSFRKYRASLGWEQYADDIKEIELAAKTISKKTGEEHHVDHIVPLKGHSSMTPMVVNPKPAAGDPLGQRGTVGWKLWTATVILQEAFMVRLEVGATN